MISINGCLTNIQCRQIGVAVKFWESTRIPAKHIEVMNMKIILLASLR